MKNTLILLMFLFFSSCTEISYIEDTDYSCLTSSEDEGRILLSAFRLNSTDKLEEFFMHWSRQCLPWENPGYNEIREKIYSLYYTVFSTHEEYYNYEYIVLPNTITYYIVSPALYDSSFDYLPDYNNKKVSLDNFTPVPQNTQKKILYLSKKYSEALNFYFNETSVTDFMYDPKKFSLEYIQEKRDFIQKKIFVYQAGWLPSIFYYSLPVIAQIYLHENLKKAKVLYRSGTTNSKFDEYEYGGNGWTKIRNISTWNDD